MPMDRSKYPPNWKEISHRIRFKRAKGKCEWCGAVHNAYEVRGANIVKIILTTAHLDHDTTHNDDDNLAALCQRCHLRHDAGQHATNAAKTRRRKQDEKTGQLRLFED